MQIRVVRMAKKGQGLYALFIKATQSGRSRGHSLLTASIPTVKYGEKEDI